MNLESFKVDYGLFPIKMHYFLFSSGICGIEIFQSTIIKQVGLTTFSMAIIYFSIPLLTLLSRILLGIFADKFHILKPLFLLSLFLSFSITLMYIFIPQRSYAKATFLCSDIETRVVLRTSEANNIQERDDKSCEIISNFNDEFYAMCAEWQINSLNSTTTRSSQFNCNRITTTIKFFKTKNNSMIEGRIVDIQDVTINKITTPHCSAIKNATSFVNCQNKIDSFAQEITSLTFWYVFTVSIVFSMAIHNAMTFTDTVCYQLLERNLYKYGQQRMFGSIGWALSAVTSGLLIEYYSDHTANSVRKNYTPVYLFSFTMLFLDALWGFKLEVKQNKNNVFELEKVTSMWGSFDVVLFTCWCLGCGIMQQISWSYFFWYLEELSDQDTSKYFKILQASYAAAYSLMGEGVLSFAFGRIAKKIGLESCMTLVLFLNVIRFLGYVVMKPSIGWVLSISCIDGAIFGMTYITITTYSRKIAQPGTETTAQAIYISIFNGMGTSIGGLCGGLMYTWLGGMRMFKIVGFSSFGACILHLFLRYISTRLARSKERFSYEFRER